MVTLIFVWLHNHSQIPNTCLSSQNYEEYDVGYSLHYQKLTSIYINVCEWVLLLCILEKRRNFNWDNKVGYVQIVCVYKIVVYDKLIDGYFDVCMAAPL